MRIRKKLVFILLAFMIAGVFYVQNTRAKETFPEVEEHDPYWEESVDRRELTLEEFLELAAQKDDKFELILIDELTLQYQKALGIPAADLVFSVKGQYDYFPRQMRGDRNTSVSLSKLFPYLGTEVSASYTTTPGFSRRENSSAVTLSFSQPIAENAFGRGVRIRDKIIGIEIDVARHQIVEAYEDYLAEIITAYIAWYEAYENFIVGDSSYRENLKLQENMEERMKSNIALPIDVNKITLQVLAKKETLIDLKTEYENALNFIEDAVGYQGSEALIPVRPSLYSDFDVIYDEAAFEFEKNSRTAKVLNLLENRSGLAVKEEFDDLLPSISLNVGNTWDWNGQGVEREDHLLFAGVTMDWSIFEQVDKAEYETAKIEKRKSKITTENILGGLLVDLKNLHQQIESQRELAAIAEEKIERARSVLEDETENYSFGKVSLNDYIDAVNTYDANRFNFIRRDVLVKNFIVEWVRLSDTLISRREIEKTHS